MKNIKQKLLGIAVILLSTFAILLSIRWEEDCGFAVVIGIPIGLLLILSKKKLLTSDIDDEKGL